MEAAIVGSLGAALAAVSVAILLLKYGSKIRFDAPDLLGAGAASLAVALVVRVTLRLHRRWKAVIGRFTAAAALCALAAVAGALVVMIPDECPGELFATDRCGVKEAATWGQVAGLAAVVNLGFTGLLLTLARGVRNVWRDGSVQGVIWIRAFGSARPRRFGARPPVGRRGARPRDPHEPKGRPTPRRADAERARRDRLRAHRDKRRAGRQRPRAGV